MVGGSVGRWYSVTGIGDGTARANGLGLYYDGSPLARYDVGWSSIWLGAVLAATALGLLTRVARLAGAVSMAVGAAALYVAVTALRQRDSVFGGFFDDLPDAVVSDFVTVSWGLFAIIGGAVAAIIAGFAALGIGGRRVTRRLLPAVVALGLGLGLGWLLTVSVSMPPT